MKLFILGAGFSAAAGLPTSSKILNKLRDARVKSMLEAVNLKVETFEELLSKIDLELFYLRRSNNDPERLTLLRNLRQTLLGKLTSMMQSILTQDSVKTYTEFLTLINFEEDAILSYNYDLVLEKILETQGIKYNYFYSVQPGQEKDLPIIKLHGSINHFHCDQCDEILTLEIKKLEEGLENYYCPQCKTLMDRALIPPTLLKRYVGTAVEEIWPKALELLQKAEELYFIGYRIPEADLLSYQLFLFSLLSRNRPYRKVEVVLGTRADNYQIFRTLYGKRGCNLVETGLYFEEWLRKQ